MNKLLLVPLMAFSFAAFAQEPAAEVAISDQFTPPMIPHPVAAYLPITPTKNACLMCHQIPKPGMQKMKGMPTPLPPSHVTGDKVNPNRYECMLCHAEVLPEKK